MEFVHLELRIGSGLGGVEPVHAQRLGGGRYRVLHTPGVVYGLAAGDELEAGADGAFRVLRRGGNLAVRVLCPTGVAPFTEALAKEVQEKLGGILDGKVRNGLVFTVPVTAGFKRVEVVFQEFTQAMAGAVWEYGNVYDESGNELDWWRHEV